MIKQSLPHLGFIQELGFLDLLSLWKHIDKSNKVTLPYPGWYSVAKFFYTY